MSQTASPSRLLPWCAAGLAVAVVALAVVLWRAGGTAALPLRDFVEYWAAGRLLSEGRNPYDPALVHDLERQAGRVDEGILMWNPPWALPLVLPLGLLPVRPAHLLWLAFNLGVVAWCGDRLWRLYGGSSRVAGPVIALSFVPTYFALIAGQISPLLLLGAVLFLVFIRRGSDLLAGAATALLAVKPHLAYLFWVAVLLWAVEKRRWRVLAGGVLAGAALTGVAMLFDPAVVPHYWHTLASQPPAQYRSPTLGTLVRLAAGETGLKAPGGAFGWQFLALVPGLVWFAFYYRRHRRSWDWARCLPMLLLVSMLTAAYGAWPFDLVLLLVPVLHAAAITRARVAAVAAHAAIGGLALVLMLAGAEYLAFIWMTPALLAGYVALLNAPVHEPAPSPRPA